MKKNLLSILGILSLAALLLSCEEKRPEYSKRIVSADEIAANLEIIQEPAGSNNITLINNNKGIGGMWDYNVGVTTLSRATVQVPFLGEQTFKFYATCDTEIVVVEKKVTVTTITVPSDPLWTLIAGDTMDGITWVWNTGLTQTGCYGAGGYGWSPIYPDWNSTSSGKGDWSDVEVFPDEYLVFDLNGSANVTLHKHNGTTEKGAFSCSSNIDQEKKDAGYIGSITFRGTTPPSAFSYYEGTPAGSTFEIAKLADGEMVLVQADPEQGGVWCDPNWSSASTHWCFKAK
jgi:hypothetical protein